MKKFTILDLTAAVSAATTFSATLADDHHESYGPRFRRPQYLDCSPRHGPRQGLDTVRRWNEIAIHASGVDHAPAAPRENRVFGEASAAQGNRVADYVFDNTFRPQRHRHHDDEGG